MTFLDTVKEEAQAVAARARKEVEDLRAKRELSQAYGELGRQAFDLVERGEISHAQLAGPAERVRTLKAESTSESAEREAPASSPTSGEPS